MYGQWRLNGSITLRIAPVGLMPAAATVMGYLFMRPQLDERGRSRLRLVLNLIGVGNVVGYRSAGRHYPEQHRTDAQASFYRFQPAVEFLMRFFRHEASSKGVGRDSAVTTRWRVHEPICSMRPRPEAWWLFLNHAGGLGKAIAASLGGAWYGVWRHDFGRSTRVGCTPSPHNPLSRP